MKMKFVVGLAVSALSLSAFAQGSVENQAIIEVVNDPAPAASAKDLSQANSQSQTVTTTTTLQPIVQNQPVITQQQPTIYVQKQESAVVEASPLSESAADKLRKQRIEMEQQTESKIVEKLEEARMKAEQERANKLLTGLEEKKEEKKEEVMAPVVAPVVVAPQAIQVVEPVIVQEVKPEPAVEVKTELAKLDEEEKKSSHRLFVGADAGFVSYPADNIKTTGAAGFTVGSVIDEKYIVEGGFLYSKGDIESVVRDYIYGMFPTIIEMEQYNFSGAFKYRILKTRLSPYVGGSLSYTYRNYEDRQSNEITYGYPALESSSWAIDLGLIVGADIRLTDSFTIGADLKYVMNVAYDTNSNGRYETSQMYDDFYTDPVEELGYYNFLINAKFTF